MFESQEKARPQIYLQDENEPETIQEARAASRSQLPNKK